MNRAETNHSFFRKRLKKVLRRVSFASLVFACFVFSVQAGSVSYTVNVMGDESCRDGAQVLAVSIGANGPETETARVAVANSSGVAVFSGDNALDDKEFYKFTAANTDCIVSTDYQEPDFLCLTKPVLEGGWRDIVLRLVKKDHTEP